MRHAAPLTLKPMDSSRNERTPLDRIPSKSVWWRPSESTRSALPIVRNQQVVVDHPLQTVWLVDLRPATEAPRGQGLAGVSIVVHRASVERRYLTRSRHLPVAVVDGSLTWNRNSGCGWGPNARLHKVYRELQTQRWRAVAAAAGSGLLY
jgi:hypothetical protein